MSLTSRPGLLFDHMGVVVRDISLGLKSIKTLLPVIAKTQRFDDPQLGVSVQFLRDGAGVVFELIAPLGASSPVAKIAASRVGVINQIAYRVDDLSKAEEYFRSNGATPTGPPKPALAFGGAMVQFFYVPEGFIVELIEPPRSDLRFEPIDS